MNISISAAKYIQMVVVIVLLPQLLFSQVENTGNITVAAERDGAYLPLLYGKKVAVVANQTSMSGEKHLVDHLLDKGVEVLRVFAPEHGFRGKVSAGEKVKDGKDPRTGLDVISLYGSNKKPTASQLSNLDIVIFDIQDVGARFYTFISTMTMVMEACAEQGVKLIVLDRPNPHGYYIDGPVLREGYESFIGLHPVPVIHGMTIGEYARMVNGEGWLKNGIKCDLEVVPCANYDHESRYKLPVKPSPNLPNEWAVTLYPSLCFFEGTTVSVGRGTEYPFQQIGAPYLKNGTVIFTPQDREGAQNPPYEGVECRGYLLREFAEFYLDGLGELYLFWLTESYKASPDKEKFFTNYFDLLAGSDELRKQIIAGLTVQEIRDGWQSDLKEFREIRKKYLLYPDFKNKDFK